LSRFETTIGGKRAQTKMRFKISKKIAGLFSIQDLVDNKHIKARMD